MNYLAQDPITNPALGEGIRGLSGTDFFANFLPRIIGLFFVIGVVVFVFIILIAAIQWMMSGGDKAGIESSRNKIWNAIMGIAILFSLFALLKVLGDFFGINILEIDIGPLKVGPGGPEPGDYYPTI